VVVLLLALLPLALLLAAALRGVLGGPLLVVATPTLLGTPVLVGRVVLAWLLLLGRSTLFGGMPLTILPFGPGRA
jgi:hypothetical protein